MKAIPLFAALLLSGCVTARPTYTQDGKVGQSITCNGGALTWAACYEKAGEVCGAKGYTIMERSGEQGGFASATPQYAVAGSTFRRSMLVQCKD